MIISILLLIPAIVAYSVSQLVMHNKFKIDNSFWDASSWKRKYKVKWLRSRDGNLPDFGQFIPALDNWYYRFFKIKYKERFPGSATIFVSLTDGYHFMQFWMFNFLALSFTVALGFNWYLLLAMLFGVRLIHVLTYKLLSR